MPAIEIANCGLLLAHYPYVEGKLIYERLHHNSDLSIKKYVDEAGMLHPKMRRQVERSAPTSPFAGRHFLLCGYTDNFWHLLCNYALRLKVVDRDHIGDDVRFVVSAGLKPGLLELFEFLGLPPERLMFIDPGGYAAFERLIVSECPITLFGGRLYGALEFASLLQEKAGTSTSGHRRIYVSRRDARWRRLTNEAEVEARLHRLGFETIELTHMSIRELATLMASAEVVVGPSGANLAAAMFCRPGTAVIELSYERFVKKYHFQLSSTLVGCRHYKIWGQAEKTEDSYHLWNFAVDLRDLDLALEIAMDGSSEFGGGRSC